MPKRKKRFSFNQLIIVIILIMAITIGIDYYFNVRQHLPQNSSTPISESNSIPVASSVPDSNINSSPATPFAENGFQLKTYRDENNQFEFQYPIYTPSDPACPSLEQNPNGFNLGAFSFSISDPSGSLSDFVSNELSGMDINKTQNIIVGGVDALQVDYQTQGMGWNGSSVFIAHNDKFYEFGILANTSAQSCGGVDDYADRVYRSVISTLKFTN